MPVRTPGLGIIGLAALLAAFATGCTVSVQPWTKAPAYPPNSVPEYPLPGMSGGLPLAGGMPTSMSAAYIELQRRLAQEEAERKIAEKRLQQAFDDLTNKDGQIQKAKYEILQASQIITETSKENKKAAAEIESLTKRIERLEETRAKMMESLMRIEMLLQHERQQQALPPNFFQGLTSPSKKPGGF